MKRHADPMQLSEGQVDVWIGNLAAWDLGLLEGSRNLLEPAENDRLDRYRSEHARTQYLAGRTLPRWTLSRYAPVSPSAWRFRTNACGRPFVREPAHGAHLFFNLSHTQGLVALAVSRCKEIGIDAEPNERALPLQHLARDLFSPREALQIESSFTLSPAHAFNAHWCMKDAFLKARGTGLTEPLDAFEFDLGGAQPRLCCPPDIEPSPSAWLMRLLDVSPSHTIALAARDHCCIRIFRCEKFL